MRLSWAPSTDAGGSGPSGYRVLRSASSSGPWTAVGAPAGTGFTDLGLPRGRTYWYAVRAVDGSGNLSAASAPVRAMPR